jgi:hypothetical protein
MSKFSKFEALSALVFALPRCDKGCCLAPATRIAPYVADQFVVERPSCDRDGGPTIQEYEYAEALRVAAKVLEDAGEHWWDDGSLNKPKA